MNLFQVEIVRSTYAMGQHLQAPGMARVDATTAHELLGSGKARLINPADAEGIAQNIAAESARASIKAQQSRPLRGAIRTNDWP